jgi:subtilisin-like proprotein convertase family protein
MKYLVIIFVGFFLSVLLPFNTNSQIITDEYGSPGYNSVLGGLGISITYVNIPHQQAFSNDSSGCIEMWINPSVLGVNPEVMISKGAGSAVSFLFGIGTNSKLYFRIGHTDFINTNGASITVNQWTHVAVTWTGRTIRTVTFYINGSASGSSVSSGASWNSNTDAIRIGGSQANPTNFFQGYIDEVRYWSISNANLILNNRFTGIGDVTGANVSSSLTSGAFYAGLISSWTFNQTGSTVYDYISGYNGTYIGSAASTPVLSGTPLPYNFAMKFSGGSNDHIRIPNNTIFQQSGDGTLEMWFKPLSFSSEQILISKGSVPNSLSFILGVTATTGKLYFGSGSSVVINQTGAGLNLNQWNHIAVAWTTITPNFEVKFYKNGKINGSPSTLPAVMPTTTDPVWVGSSLLYNLSVKGWIDELRLWNPALTEQQIRTYMFVSGKTIPASAGILASWNFDGNLNNTTITTGITGSLNNSSNNNACRFSGYSNDTLSGSYSSNFISHSTVINRNTSPNPFPSSYNINNPFLAIPDNNPAGISDSIIISGTPGVVTAVEVFLGIDHTYVGDLIVSVTAPNGTSKILTNNNGAGGKNIMTFFNDNFTNLPSTPNYLAPWGYLKPVTAMGSFNNSPVNGYWKIKVVDNAGSDAGVLKGWGIKLDFVTGTGQTGSEIPKVFKLIQNYPNPFNPSTKIAYHLPKATYVSLKVFDASGRTVKELENGRKDAGIYEYEWNASDLSSGVYFYKLTAGDFTDTKRMILVK